MKKFSIVILLLFSFFSCNKINKTTDFNLNYEFFFTISASSPVQTAIQSDPIRIITDIDTVTAENNTSTDLINKVNLNTIKLTITNNTNTNFDFLSDIDLYVKGDGLPEIRFAWKNNIQNNTNNSIELILLGDNIKTYFKKDWIEITPYFTLKNKPAQDIRIKVEMTLSAEADLLES